MPTYDFRNNETGEEWEAMMSIADKETFLAENPHITQIPNAVLIHSGRGLGGGLKIDNSFNDVLKEIKHKHSGGYKLGRSNIHTK